MASAAAGRPGPSKQPDVGSSTATPDDDGTQLTYNETIDALCAFIKTAVCTILCHRQVYPPNVFSRKQRYRVPVWASRHPGLDAYIDDVIAAVKTQIQRSLVRSVHMVITSKSTESVLERYRFDLDFILQDVALRDRNFSIPGNMTMQSMELQLRAFMMKLISMDGALYDIEDPEDVTWALVLDMKDGCQPGTSDTHGNEPEQGLWVPFEADAGINGAAKAGRGPEKERPSYLRAARRQRDDDDPNDSLIVPIKSLDTGVINLMLYVEEHPSAKHHLSASKTTQTKGTPRKTADVGRRKRTDGAPDEEARYGERDIDEPLQQPSSSGVAVKASSRRAKKKLKQKDDKGEKVAGSGTVESDDDASDSDASAGSSGSADSIRSVNDFAGYGKGPGGVGMSGVGM